MNRNLRVALSATSLLMISGCASNSTYGSFLSDDTVAPLERLAADAVARISETHKPAKTRLALQHPMEDAFGTVFVASLREAGFSVHEYKTLGQAQTSRNSSTTKTAPTAIAAAPAAPAAPAITFAVRERETVRETLTRWSKDAGWTHLPEHYTIDFDVQILGTVAPYTDFRTGVRALLATTSMTQKPLQPCFYSNQVLRVILRTQRCDQI